MPIALRNRRRASRQRTRIRQRQRVGGCQDRRVDAFGKRLERIANLLFVLRPLDLVRTRLRAIIRWG
jgi:hypothetical protein